MFTKLMPWAYRKNNQGIGKADCDKFSYTAKHAFLWRGILLGINPKEGCKANNCRTQHADSSDRMIPPARKINLRMTT